MDGVQIVVAPNMTAEGKPVIIIGFHAEWFSQTVTLPYQGKEDTYKLADSFDEALAKASLQIEEHLNALRDQEKREEVSDS